MKRKAHNFWRRLGLTLGVTSELTAKEKLDIFMQDQKQINLIERIKAIRQDGFYEPDYEKPKSYTEFQIIGNGQPISDKTRVSAKRPIFYDGNVLTWKQAISEEYARQCKQEAENKLRELQKEQQSELIKETLAPLVMERMLKID